MLHLVQSKPALPRLWLHRLVVPPGTFSAQNSSNVLPVCAGAGRVFHRASSHASSGRDPDGRDVTGAANNRQLPPFKSGLNGDDIHPCRLLLCPNTLHTKVRRITRPASAGSAGFMQPHASRSFFFFFSKLEGVQPVALEPHAAPL